MEVTYKNQAIILAREPYGENDSRVFVYTRDFGKLDLVARGTQKLSSKLAAHIEPLNLGEIMVVRGKQYDYLGSVVSEKVFAGIKDNYEKTAAAGEIVKLIKEIIKDSEQDEQVFLMLNKFLEILNNNEINSSQLILLKSAFALKLISRLGYQPQLDDLKIGNIKASKKITAMAKLILQKKLNEIITIDIESELIKEFSKVINSYKLYLFD
ncbi:DNA repair protein RecO [Candidatus Falkowbacteria bacterium CG10_big_fil_rev_8_21_14_0_10_43_11]|uniref:DNA repair protein RecO n=1 Tax=Candidatus Falkowbacteria bacterium CG10_big_fil_rev_8_21_14_0_10_43_11 TaxID=1974568 RepID=A0A2M6WLH0_9BACT|nr:MAG: DNA repair protein RecO [Candidatus Falkowbacteria bacterium CG10_big_fil_rev_8_21_14_0_10_43_11]